MSMDDLTNRQTDILKALIREYTETGEPIGSEMLEKKYRLGFSPATIRNEMVVLEKKAISSKSISQQVVCRRLVHFDFTSII